MRIVFLNALPLNAIPLNTFMIYCTRDMDRIRFFVDAASEIESYIRHEATVKLVSELFKINLKQSSGLYTYQRDDKLIVVTLKRPTRGVEMETVKPEDLDILLCDVKTIEELFDEPVFDDDP